MTILLLKLTNIIREPAFLLLLLSSAGIGLAQLLEERGGKRKGERAHLAGRQEKSKAQHAAFAQMRAPRPDSAAYCLGRPKSAEDTSVLPIPDAQQSTMVIGAPGVGKTVSVLQPAILSCLEQGFPMLLFDGKYDKQTARIVPIALELGYKVHYFAPGHLESGVLNLFDFIEKPTDLSAAREIAKGLQANTRPVSPSMPKSDPFFDEAGLAALSAGMALAKGTQYPDLLMTHAFLSLSSLPQRVEQAKDLNPWIKAAFGQLISIKDSDRTVGSIMGTAVGLLNTLMLPDVASVVCGASTIPLRLHGKQLLVLGLDRKRRKVMAPLLGAVMQVLIQENTAFKRQDPLCLAIDELPLLTLPDLSAWLNQHREDGLLWLLGIQHRAQCEAVYGRDATETILGACATKFYFNPQHEATARQLSNELGQYELRNFQKSRSWNSGRSGSTSRSVNEQWQWRPLLPVHVILGFKKGECIVQNPHYENQKRGYLPLRHRFTLNKTLQRSFERSSRRWAQTVKPRLIQQQRHSPMLAEGIAVRQALAAELLPLQAQPPPDWTAHL